MYVRGSVAEGEGVGVTDEDDSSICGNEAFEGREVYEVKMNARVED